MLDYQSAGLVHPAATNHWRRLPTIVMTLITRQGKGRYAMKVFISWSGEASREVAIALSDWFPKVLQGVETFVSAKDIDKGANWITELTRELEDTDFGVVCLTPENLLSPWLHYEAGAITRSVESRVCPVLHGVKKGQVKAPIAQLQMTDINLNDFKLLMQSMNKTSGGLLSLPAVDEAVDVWWSHLDAAVKDIEVPVVPEPNEPPEPEKPEPSSIEMLAEVLHRTRELDRRMRRMERGSGPSSPVNLSNEGTRLERDVARTLSRDGIAVKMVVNTFGGCEVRTSDPLPQPLSDSLRHTLGKLARDAQIEISVVGPNRGVKFDSDGHTNDPPF